MPAVSHCASYLTRFHVGRVLPGYSLLLAVTLTCASLPLLFPPRREAETHFAMRHDNIVRLLAFSEGGPQRPPCMVMERMEESLCTFLQTVDPPPSLGESLETVRDICQVTPRLRSLSTE